MTKGTPVRGAKRVKPKNPKSRKASSNKWLERQLNDPFVRAAKTKGYRSRAAFKLSALDDKFHFLRPGSRILDLGAAPGGWSQVARQRVGAKGYVVAVDISPLEPIAGAGRLWEIELTGNAWRSGEAMTALTAAVGEFQTQYAVPGKAKV